MAKFEGFPCSSHVVQALNHFLFSSATTALSLIRHAFLVSRLFLITQPALLEHEAEM
jgi:hypothetical protein